MNDSLSIVIPAFDESERLGSSLRQILQFAEKKKGGAEVIVVDDGSTDGTGDTSRNVFAEFGNVPAKVVQYDGNRGKGFAVRAGLREAQGKIALFTDADLSTPIEESPKLIDPIRNGKVDVTFGSRALDRSLIGTHQPWRREQGGKVFNLIVRKMTGLPYWDTQCGFKAFDMEKFRPLLDVMTIDRFGFDVEFLYVARLHKLRLAEIPVRWNHDERTKVNVFRDSRRMFGEVAEIRRNARKGVYDIDGKA
jgi:dolichyl-phosphate beta-glucosyltransferase